MMATASLVGGRYVKFQEMMTSLKMFGEAIGKTAIFINYNYNFLSNCLGVRKSEQ